MKKPKVMVIAPYEGLKETVASVAEGYRDRMDLTLALGDLTTGIVQARAAEAKGCDVIISRGGTAEMIARNVSIPVVSIEISGYDYMRAIKLAENIRGRKAFVGFSNITKRARSVNELLQTDVEIFTVHAPEEIAPLLKRLTAKGFDLIIGDVATCREAEELDINNMLLTSGEESVLSALESAVAWTGAYSAPMEQLQILREVVSAGDEQVTVLDGEGKIVYSNASLARYGLDEAALGQLSREVSAGSDREILMRRDNGTLYIRLNWQGGDRLRAFYFRWKPEDEQQYMGITVRNFIVGPAGRDFIRHNGIHSPNVIQTARSFSLTNRPVLLTGDVGVGKTDLAVSIHRYSDHAMQPFVLINCTVVNPASLAEWLLGAGATMQQGATICFEMLDALDRKGQKRVSEILDGMDPNLWRFIATARPDIQQKAMDGAFDFRLCRFFSELCLYIPNLSQSSHDLGKIINLYIIEANSKLGRQIIGMDADALERVKRHLWHNNFAELQQAVYQMVLIAEGPLLRVADVEATLAAREPAPEETALNLEGSLEQIELRVIKKVLQEENGNLSRTSERLQIGRSTLWRKLRAGEDIDIMHK